MSIFRNFHKGVLQEAFEKIAKKRGEQPAAKLGNGRGRLPESLAQLRNALRPLSEEKKSRNKVRPRKTHNGAARTLQALCKPAARKMHAG